MEQFSLAGLSCRCVCRFQAGCFAGTGRAPARCPQAPGFAATQTLLEMAPKRPLPAAAPWGGCFCPGVLASSPSRSPQGLSGPRRGDAWREAGPQSRRGKGCSNTLSWEAKFPKMALWCFFL